MKRKCSKCGRVLKSTEFGTMKKGEHRDGLPIYIYRKACNDCLWGKK